MCTYYLPYIYTCILLQIYLVIYILCNKKAGASFVAFIIYRMYVGKQSIITFHNAYYSSCFPTPWPVWVRRLTHAQISCSLQLSPPVPRSTLLLGKKNISRGFFNAPEITVRAHLSALPIVLFNAEVQVLPLTDANLGGGVSTYVRISLCIIVGTLMKYDVWKTLAPTHIL